MPPVFLALAGASASIFGGGAALTVGLAGLYGISTTAIGGTIISAAVSAGISLLSSLLFRPDTPKPQDQQQSVKNPIQPRSRHYGRVKISGSLAFLESKGGALYKVIATGTGQLDAVEQLWIDDKLVTVNGSFLVNEEPWYDEGDHKLRIETRLGLPTETAYSHLTAAFPDWDADHRGDGVSSIYIVQFGSAAERIPERFPNTVYTLYRTVARASLVYNPVTTLTAWSDNAAAIVRDYIVHPDGMRLPSSLVTTTQAAAGWLAGFNRAEEAVTLKAGGTEDRYRIWGSYRFDERPAEVIGRMLAACDGRLIPTPDGGLTIDIGDWEEPTLTLDETIIVGFSDVARGLDIINTANVIRAVYTSPDHDYQATDADQWIDVADVAARGEISTDMSFMMSPSHAQTRRLMKLAAYRANPSWIGTFQCNLGALAAFGKRFIRITYAPLGIDEVFEIQDFRLDIVEGDILAGCTVQVISMPSEAYDWDASSEEGTAPLAEVSEDDSEIPVPANFDVTAPETSVARMEFDAPPSEDLRTEGRYRMAGATDWTPVPISTGATSVDVPIAPATDYEFQVRYVSAVGTPGDWTASEFILAAPGTLDFSKSTQSAWMGAI